MKLFHIADLHIGKSFESMSLVPDQEHILAQILRLAEDLKPDGVMIAGDVYDKSVPPGEAVGVLDDFLTRLTEMEIPVFVISGNHDSPERLNFGSRILSARGLHIAGTFDTVPKRVRLEDAFGPLDIWLLPFIKPPAVARYYPQGDTQTYQSAMKTVLDAAGADCAGRNVLIAHQFVTGGGRDALRSDSETASVGGLDNMDASVFDAFDYVALGHLHRPQACGRETVRYAGSPLKYSFSEATQDKSLSVVELRGKGDVEIKTVPMVPLRDMRVITGPIDKLIHTAKASGEGLDDYIRAVITDEDVVVDAMGKLRQVYPNVMSLDFLNSRSGSDADSKTAAVGDVAAKSPEELFSEFYLSMNNTPLSPEELSLLREVTGEAGEDER